ncbi:MAG: CPBP family intramembrane metalloprotease [Clostridia bacterium]|nr:CPBP family intramembrane metalloprotease [Clostridia bacterium]
MILICIIGGYFTTIYTLQSFDQSLLEETIKQIGSKELFIAVSVAQISLYAVIFAGIGIILSNKIGLWKKFEINKKAIIGVIVISILGGLGLSVVDRYIFGSFINPVLHSYDNKPTFEYIVSAFTYGGVFEEILMRLFLMSLFSWIIAKIFYRKEKEIPTKVFAISNIITALLFAAGHIPATIKTFGYIDALLLFRCFLMNGAFGIAFGWLYRKYGIGYSMLAHFGAHLISKVIWLLFI